MLNRGTDGALFHRWYDGGQWSTWQNLGQSFASAPTVTSWALGRLDVLLQGNDHALYHDWWDGSSWNIGENLGGVLASAPSAASWGAGRIDVFVRGPDGTLWHRCWNGLSWCGWEPLGGRLSAAPAVASWGPNRLDVFGRGLDGALWHMDWDGSAWSGWERLGGQLTADPGAVSWGPSRVDVVVNGADSSLWHMDWAGTAWSGWEPLGGHLTSGESASAAVTNRLDVIARGDDNALWHKWWDGSAWADWHSIGGQPTSNIITDVPYYRQAYELSCEEASLQMALGHEAIVVNQSQELTDIGIDWRSAYFAAGILHWGDPYTNFVGDPNGSEAQLTGYGTYWQTVARVASSYSGAVLAAGEGLSPQDVYNAVLESHPVVVWVSFDWQFHPAGTWLAFDGRWVQYEGPVEHAVTVVGVSPDSVYVYNPWYGPQWEPKSTFEAAYATYNRMGVILR